MTNATTATATATTTSPIRWFLDIAQRKYGNGLAPARAQRGHRGAAHGSQLNHLVPIPPADARTTRGQMLWKMWPAGCRSRLVLRRGPTCLGRGLSPLSREASAPSPTSPGPAGPAI